MEILKVKGFLDDKLSDKPDLLNDYDAVVFDLDNCLASYKMEEISKLIIDGYLTALTDNFNYPLMSKTVDFDIKLNNAIWDIENGTII